MLILISGSMVSKENRIIPELLFYLTSCFGEWLYTLLRKKPQAAFSTLEPYCNRLEDLPKADRDFLYQRVNERAWIDGQDIQVHKYCPSGASLWPQMISTGSFANDSTTLAYPREPICYLRMLNNDTDSLLSYKVNQVWIPLSGLIQTLSSVAWQGHFHRLWHK